MNAQSKVSASPHVYQAIADVQGELAKVGIAKSRRNTQGSGYDFRGIDDVYAALSPLLSAHKLVVIPRVLAREVIERQSKAGGALFYVTVHAEFDFISAVDGTTHTAATFGEAMDSGDKATNKAMSAAYKYAAFMTFAIPTEGDNDADASTHEVVREKVPGIHKIKERLRKMLVDGDAMTDSEAFSALVKANKDDLKTIRDANHEWWTGDGDDFEGYGPWIDRRRSELAPQSLNLQMLLSVLETCATRNDLNALLEEHGAVAEELDGEESRAWQTAYNAHEAAIMAANTVSAG